LKIEDSRFNYFFLFNFSIVSFFSDRIFKYCKFNPNIHTKNTKSKHNMTRHNTTYTISDWRARIYAVLIYFYLLLEKMKQNYRQNFRNLNPVKMWKLKVSLFFSCMFPRFFEVVARQSVSQICWSYVMSGNCNCLAATGMAYFHKYHAKRAWRSIAWVKNVFIGSGGPQKQPRICIRPPQPSSKV